MFGLDLLARFIKILRSNVAPSQIAGGFILGMLLGITPFWTLINWTLLLLLIILNLNIATAIFAYLIFSALVYIFDPLFHELGFWLLVNVEGLKPLWTTLYHSPVIPYSSFNNTVNLGSFLIGLILLAPVYIGAKKFIVVYREKYEPRVQNWKFIKLVKATPVYKWYEKLSFLGE